MKIDSISAIEYTDLIGLHVDSYIFASGYESRASTIASLISEKSSFKKTNRYKWGFEEYSDDKIRRINDSLFKKIGCKSKTFRGSDCRNTEAEFAELLLDNEDTCLTIFIDISCMTRNWYGAIVKALSRSKRSSKVRVIFAYVPSRWSSDKRPFPPNEILGPVLGYSSHALPNKPTALVIGLGADEDRALGLKDHLDPRLTVCFFASPSIDTRYEDEVLKANDDLLSDLAIEHKYAYNIFDVFGTYKILESVCQGLSRSYRVVLASLGPKIFGLYSFLLATCLPEVSVWRVSPASRQPPFDHKPAEIQVFVDVVWVPQENLVEMPYLTPGL